MDPKGRLLYTVYNERVSTIVLAIKGKFRYLTYVIILYIISQDNGIAHILSQRILMAPILEIPL